jgi:hypothetical protein
VAYETFERRSVRVDTPAITVRPEGRIAINAAASRLLEKAGVKAVRILWDKATCGLALQATEKGDKVAYSIAFGGGARSASLTVKSFFHHIGWSSERRQTVPARWDEQRRMLEATLPSRFVKPGRKKPDQ